MMAIKEEDHSLLRHYFDEGQDEEAITEKNTGSDSTRWRRDLIRSVCFFMAGALSVIGVLLISTLLSPDRARGTWSTPSRIQNSEKVPDPYSPANSVIEYEYRPLIESDPRFIGKPGELWNKSMHQLLNNTLLRLSLDELDLLGESSIPLEKGGFAAGLGVAHNLHCVKKLKKFLYKEQFYADLDPASEKMAYIQAHADHCLDWLRQSILCHVDYSVYTVFWGERGLQQDPPIPTHKYPEQLKCVNWNKLQDWMQARAANTDELVRV